MDVAIGHSYVIGTSRKLTFFFFKQLLSHSSFSFLFFFLLNYLVLVGCGLSLFSWALSLSSWLSCSVARRPLVSSLR